MTSEQASKVLKDVGLCGAVSDDGHYGCLLDPKHEGKHGFECEAERQAALEDWQKTHTEKAGAKLVGIDYHYERPASTWTQADENKAEMEE